MRENRTWTITCRRQLVKQCLDEYTIEADEKIRSTAAAEKELRAQGWTLHDDDGTCPVCMEVWDGNIRLADRGVTMVTEGGGSRADRPLVRSDIEVERTP